MRKYNFITFVTIPDVCIRFSQCGVDFSNFVFTCFLLRFYFGLTFHVFKSSFIVLTGLSKERIGTISSCVRNSVSTNAIDEHTLFNQVTQLICIDGCKPLLTILGNFYCPPAQLSTLRRSSCRVDNFQLEIFIFSYVVIFIS